MYLIGVDVGGTFTDLVCADTVGERTLIHKVPTTAADPSQGVIAGLAELCAAHGIDPAQIDLVFHGTTVATNAVLEHDGARSGMVTTEGFRDILHIGRHWRPENYSIQLEIPWQDRPLVRRRHRLAVRERLVPPRGEVLYPLDEDAVRRAAEAFRKEGVESVAVCFLFSYLNPRHEERAKQILCEELPDCFITTSAEVAPQFREFERFTTAALNAFVGPKLRTYVANLDAGLKQANISADLHIMGSHGGVMTAATVAEKPVMSLLSGPAAGVLGGAWAGANSGRDRLITFDVGGTSADIGIVVDGTYGQAMSRDTWIGGQPVLIPMIDINTIGAGGGSIAYVDEGGAFQVGPESAGSEPGPAAYGRGGDRPTVTDANLVLGRLDKENFLGGAMRLDEAAATRVIDRLARELQVETRAAAEGVLTIVNSNMANAIRARTIQKGLDPREFSLVAFGGAGPLHGAEVAAMLDIPEVIVPPHPGITSATGLLTTDLKYEQFKTEFQVQGQADAAVLGGDFERLERALLTQYACEGMARDKVRLARSGDLRYVGQGYELRAAFPDGALDAAALDEVWRTFHQMHKSEYGHFFPDSPIEIVNIRVSGIGEVPNIGLPSPEFGPSLDAARVRTGPCLFRVADRLQSFETAYYWRDRLPAESAFRGPAVILQRDTTTVVPPGWSATAERSGNIIIASEG
jgi:N-methylhydantoinase A